MIARTDHTLLDKYLATGIKVDLDSANVAIAQSLPFRPSDMTSNQAILGDAVLDEQNKDFVKSVVKGMPDAGPLDIFTVLHAKFAAKILPFIDGRCLAQTSPHKPHDKQAIIAHARQYAKAYNAEGITNDRFCIKVPTTTAGVQAAVVLNQEGISTLGTAMFNVPQAIAAAQAGMYAISPYFNKIPAHGSADVWPNPEDPSSEHPMAWRMAAITEAYAAMRSEGMSTPQIKGASYISLREVLAQPALGVEAVTLLSGPLDDLVASGSRGVPSLSATGWKVPLRSYADDTSVEWSEWTAPTPAEGAKLRTTLLAGPDPLGAVAADIHSDYLAPDVLDRINESDLATQERLADALALFQGAEDSALAYIAWLQGGEVGPKPVPTGGL